MVRLAIWASHGAVSDIAVSVCRASTLQRTAPMIMDMLWSLPVGEGIVGGCDEGVDDKFLRKEMWMGNTQLDIVIGRVNWCI